MEYNVPMTANEIMDKLDIKSKETLRSTYLDPVIKEEVVSLTIQINQQVKIKCIIKYNDGTQMCSAFSNLTIY